MALEFETFSTRQQQAAVCAALLTQALSEGCDSRGWASLACAGGSTPRLTYEYLSRAVLPWSDIAITTTDERLVPPGDAHSNQRLISDSLLAGEAGDAALVPLWHGRASADAATEVASRFVQSLLPFDAVVVGMGEDGAIASLGPSAPSLPRALDADAAPAVVMISAEHGRPLEPRLSLSLGSLLDSRSILLLVSGRRKLSVLEAALTDARLPVHHLLNQTRTPVHILWAE